MISKKDQFAQENFYVKHLLETIVMLLQLPKKETFKLCKLKKL